MWCKEKRLSQRLSSRSPGNTKDPVKNFIQRIYTHNIRAGRNWTNWITDKIEIQKGKYKVESTFLSQNTCRTNHGTHLYSPSICTVGITRKDVPLSKDATYSQMHLLLHEWWDTAGDMLQLNNDEAP
ncbi:Titin [Manis pentadactyla]|nr:Titin [Manis pentadactyla]